LLERVLLIAISSKQLKMSAEKIEMGLFENLLIREMTSLPKLRLFDELLTKLTHSEARKDVASSFERTALKLVSEGDHDMSDGEGMAPHYILHFLRKQ
jgi:hypothetical protein